jgi:hypothetical protein
MRLEVERVWPGIIEYLQFQIPVHGYVSDEEMQPIRAKIEIENLSFFQNETNYSNEKRNGLYHIW